MCTIRDGEGGGGLSFESLVLLYNVRKYQNTGTRLSQSIDGLEHNCLHESYWLWLFVKKKKQKERDQFLLAASASSGNGHICGWQFWCLTFSHDKADSLKKKGLWKCLNVSLLSEICSVNYELINQFGTPACLKWAFGIISDLVGTSLKSPPPHLWKVTDIPHPHTIQPAVSSPTLTSLHTDTAGHTDDKSAQIFMSMEFTFFTPSLRWSPHSLSNVSWLVIWSQEFLSLCVIFIKFHSVID